jgi:hypothetical protein
MTAKAKARLRYNVLPAVPLVVSLLTVGIVMGSSACTGTPGGKVVQTVLDVSDAVCEVLTANDIGGGTVKIVCKYIDAADKNAHVFMATVPREQAVRMGLMPPARMLASSASASAAPLPTCAPAVVSAIAPSVSTVAPTAGSSAKPAASAAAATSGKPAKK